MELMDYATDVERLTCRIDQLNTELDLDLDKRRRDTAHRRRAAMWRQLGDTFAKAGPSTRALVRACDLAARYDEAEASPEVHHARRMNPAADLLKDLDDVMGRLR